MHTGADMVDDKEPAIKRKNLVFNNQHDAYCFQARYQKLGYIKKCFHAKVVRHRAYASAFTTKCLQSSYRFVEDGEYFIGCPEPCTFYQPIAIGKWKKITLSVRKKIHQILLKFVKTVKWVLEWFASLSPMVQLIFAFTLLIITLGNSPVINLLLDLIKMAK